MQLIRQFRFFCDHYFFDLFDSQVELRREAAEMRTVLHERRGDQRGWYRTTHAIKYCTLADLNDHRFDIYSADHHTTPPDADRVLAHNIDVRSGRVTVFSLGSGKTTEIGIGKFVVYCHAFNLGRERAWESDRPSDEEILRRDDLERYELVFVPGIVDEEGVISGPSTLEPFYPRRQEQRERRIKGT